MTSFGRLMVFSALLFSLGAVSARADNLTTIAGKSLPGKLVSIGPEGVVFASTDRGEMKVGSKEIHAIDLGQTVVPLPKDLKYHELELTDGSTFRIAKFAIKGKQVAAELLAGPKAVSPPAYDIPLGSVFSVMRNAEDPKNREAWKKVLAGRGKRDLYVIREAEGLSFVTGTIQGGNEAGDVLTFEKLDGSTTELRLSRATGGLVFAQPASSDTAPTLCKVYDTFGNTLIARAVSVDASGATVTTVSGVVVKYPGRGGISKLDYALGNMAYLSDLEPLVDVPPAPPDEKGLRLNVTAPFTRDKLVSNEPLKLGTEVYPKGISVAPETRLTYNIGGDYREFRAVVGVQEKTPDGNLEARLTIETEEGRVLFSEVLKRKDKPRTIGLDVKGAKQIRISVEADFPVNGNTVILADAKVQK